MRALTYPPSTPRPQVYTWRRQMQDRNTLFRAWDDWPTLGKRETGPNFPLPHTLHLLATGGLAGISAGGAGARRQGAGGLTGAQQCGRWRVDLDVSN